MKATKRLFCRGFQGIMRMAIPLMPYREPKLISTPEDVVKILKEHNAKSVMIVTDKVIRGLGLTETLEGLIQNAEIECTVYDETMPNPTSDNVNEATDLYLKSESQALIAFGGGSAMDCAKAKSTGDQ